MTTGIGYYAIGEFYIGESAVTAPAVGSQQDFVNRIKAVLPRGWFADTTPVLDVMLNGTAEGLAWAYSIIAWLRQQIRIASASGVVLDLIAQDFFGSSLSRFPVESDTAFRARIYANLIQPRGTRAAVISALQRLTGRTPIIFEPANTGDTGGYGHSGALTWTGMAYGDAGGWGSTKLPYQAFITAYRPLEATIGNVVGYYAGSGWAGGGYGVGGAEYLGASMIQAQVPDAAIYQTIAATAPAGTIMWTKISS